MRIIAGEFRGRRLLPPEGDATRPITDRVKQSVFDILAPSIPGSAVYDLFAGTGSMGLECLSRGATHATFFEADRSALARLRKNIETLKVGERCRVVAGDLFAWFAEAPPAVGDRDGSSAPPGLRGSAGEEPDAAGSHDSRRGLQSFAAPRLGAPGGDQSPSLVFLDPPYRFLQERADDLRQVARRLAGIAPHACVVFRHDAADELALPPFQDDDVRGYGGMTVEFLRATDIRDLATPPPQPSPGVPGEGD